MSGKTRAPTRLVTSLVVVSILAAPHIAGGAEAQEKEAQEKAPASPPRGELLLGLGGSAGLSDWTGDPVSYGALAVGVRLFGVITPFAEARVGGGRVDQRMLTFLSIGIAGTFHVSKKVAPRAFVGAVHQHEESLAVVAEEPLGALVGIGGGIRHRAGLQLGVGCDFTVYEKERFVLTVGPELRGAYLTYSSGPNWYGQIGATANGHFRLF